MNLYRCGAKLLPLTAVSEEIHGEVYRRRLCIGVDLQLHIRKNRGMVGKGQIIVRGIPFKAADKIHRSGFDQNMVDSLFKRRFFIRLVAVSETVVVPPIRICVFGCDIVRV